LKNAAAMRFTACRHLLGPLALAACGTSTATTPDAGTTSRRDASYSADANTDARTALPDARRVDAPPVDAHPSLVDGGFSVILSAEGGTPISPLLYGVNYDWNLVPAGLFPAYAASMADAGYRLVRYPGGFNAEHYDWSTNTETPWGKWDGGEAGVSPVTLLATVPAASFITPSAAALAKEGGAAAIPSLATLSSNLVSTYASQVKLWEIGNEPWRSGGGLNDRATEEHDLASYAALVKTVAPTLKAQDPSILVYATWDWFPANQDDWSTLVSLVGPTAWASVDGIAIHPYCGTDPTEPLCSQIPSQIKLMSAAMGKTNFFVSEWSVTVSDTADAAIDQSFGIKNASELALAYQALAQAGVYASTYWPSNARGVPGGRTAFFSVDYSKTMFDGALFTLLTHVYTGTALPTLGIPALASRRADGSVAVIVPTQPSMGPWQETVTISLRGTGLHGASQTEPSTVLYSANPDLVSAVPQKSPLPVVDFVDPNGDPAVRFVVNPGTAGRGSSWEIASVVLR
jgi:hypothetical protein